MSLPRPAGGDPWLRVLRGGAHARLRLVCLPHAGGSAGFFQHWAARLPDSVDVLAVRYPGRQDRFGEPCVDRMDVLADRVTASLAPYLDRPLALFGHSMGASVAYEVAVRLEERLGIVPTVLFVSGHGAPHVTRIHQDPDHLDDEEFLGRVAALGEVDPVVFRSRKLRELVVPALRADLRLLHRYLPRAARTVSAPVTAYLGTGDPTCDRESVSAWAELTTGGFRLRTYPGDHFYLVPARAELLADLTAHLAGRPTASRAAASVTGHPT
ncbi:alpha/beta fold hydrolase [Micromonospora sp. CPCC 205546]|uniref:thioesterase II family protein n=1 Tax=Micromonospora sp. CPCC 205546 TaxID=3122397 RepID=UPI002FF3A34E